MKNKPHVIFIQSAGHSGSTLLDMILGTADNAISLGEIRQWNKYFTPDSTHPEPRHEKQRFDTCTCGANLDNDECSFWNKIHNKYGYTITLPENKNLKKDIAGYLVTYYTLEQIAPLNNDYIRLLIELQEKTGCNTFIDSSKSIQWMLMLARHYQKRDIDLSVILLERDARGVYYSHKKIQRNPRKELAQRRFMHKARNLIVESENIPSVHITYEALNLDNENAIEKIEGMGLDLENWQEKVQATTYHLIGGNPMRFKKFKGLKYDNSWVEKLGSVDKILCKLFK